ncbi:MAG: hypothetical protein K9J16_02575 [Melioribacteraceae bacterium]|nr:hypothetical protein [Melioribacteraceae bacterium]MCF8352893.1 hypothetical protein [Melioribacteraceae bacterium]MCF8393790.1 hypothetical protein [Melioribacteraceae bacterium]MCF8417410.1 hypothetical protein [Melioribacteraceae bacterium]
MRNSQTCENCKTENHFYQLTCTNCGSYLRSRVVNIDLWRGIWRIFDSPSQTFTEIIYAEHKNFVIFLTIIFSLSFFAQSILLKHALNINSASSNYLLINLLISAAAFALYLVLFSLLLKLLTKLFKVQTRFKDNFSIFLFSLTPALLTLIFLTPIEYAIFGKHWFVYNPSPFMIKENAAYVLIGIEGIMAIWRLVLSIIAVFVQTKNLVFSLVVGTLFFGLYNALLLFTPFLPF